MSLLQMPLRITLGRCSEGVESEPEELPVLIK